MQTVWRPSKTSRRRNDRILVSGSVSATVLYQPEGETGLRRLDVPLSFAHIEEGRGVGTDSVCFVRCSVAAVNARAVNSRKVSVTARLCFEATAYHPETLTYTEQVEGGETPLEVLYDTREVSLLHAANTGEFTVLDDLELNHADDLELLHTDCTLRQNECRAMNGRVLVRGEAMLRLLVRDDTGSLQQITQNVPFTQTIDVEGLTEGEPVTLRLAVRNVDCVLANGGLLSVGVGASALVLRDGTHAVRTIRDLYQTKHELPDPSESGESTLLRIMWQLCCRWRRDHTGGYACNAVHLRQSGLYRCTGGGGRRHPAQGGDGYSVSG